jgi:hypothetical protein
LIVKKIANFTEEGGEYVGSLGELCKSKFKNTYIMASLAHIIEMIRMWS